MKRHFTLLLLLGISVFTGTSAQCELPITNPVVTPILMTANGLQASQSFTVPNCTGGFFSQLTIYTETNNSNVTLRICPGTPPYANGIECYEQSGISWSVVEPQSFTINLANDDPLLAYTPNEVFTFELTSDSPFQLGMNGTGVDAYPQGNYYDENQLLQANQDLFFSFASVATLPVTYSHFSASRQREREVTLEWATQSEVNNRGFAVQRRETNANRWETIGFVAAGGDEGALVRRYAFTDAGASASVNYYRLRQEDYDGDRAYSSIVSVGAISAPTVNFYPNPMRNGESLQLSAAATLTLYDQSGRQIFSAMVPARQHTLPGDLPAGHYLVRTLTETGTVSVQPLVIVQ